MIPLAGIGDFAAGYDGLIIDLWGVLHDGHSAYPGAVDTLAALKAAGKGILLLSNAPRRVAPLIEQMAGLGIGRHLYDHLLSSGEAVHGELERRADPFFAALGRRLFLMGPRQDDSIFAGLDYRPVGLGDADFILCTGPWGEETVDDFLPALRHGVERGLPLICANPDRVVIRQGRAMPCAGALADRYQELGGQVVWRGKPDIAIYQQALALLGSGRARTLCIGDGMPTDIRGAAAAGLDSVLVGRGIHAAELGPGLDAGRLAALSRRFGCAPTAAVMEFVW
jgi:HAD superfamily hydrolase (TIGR01459 family)